MDDDDCAYDCGAPADDEFHTDPLRGKSVRACFECAIERGIAEYN